MSSTNLRPILIEEGSIALKARLFSPERKQTKAVSTFQSETVCTAQCPEPETNIPSTSMIRMLVVLKYIIGERAKRVRHPLLLPIEKNVWA